MTVSVNPAVTRTVDLASGTSLQVTEFGDPSKSPGSAVLMLHGGGGHRTVAGFAAALAEHAYVIAPVHPGFDGTDRPERADSIADLATFYLDLLDQLRLSDVLVVGSSIGGWIASEMALRDNHGRLGGLILVNAVGIRAHDNDEIADVRAVTPSELGKLSFYNPALRIDPANLNDQQRAAMAANQEALIVYAGEPYMHDPKLRDRLHRVTNPVLVIWGAEDGVVGVDYGRAYAEAFPGGQFVLVPEAGHLPHIEQPARVMKAVGGWVEAELKTSTAS